MSTMNCGSANAVTAIGVGNRRRKRISHSLLRIQPLEPWLDALPGFMAQKPGPGAVRSGHLAESGKHPGAHRKQAADIAFHPRGEGSIQVRQITELRRQAI